MGIESVLYRLEPTDCEVRDLIECLRSRGATKGDTDGTYVLSGTDYWIDVLVRARGSSVAVVQFRVAVTNPPSVTTRLHELISDLLDRFGGQVKDAHGRGVGSDQELLDVLVTEFHSGREPFTQTYGELALPISADEVFAQMRALSEED